VFLLYRDWEYCLEYTPFLRIQLGLDQHAIHTCLQGDSGFRASHYGLKFLVRRKRENKTATNLITIQHNSIILCLGYVSKVGGVGVITGNYPVPRIQSTS